MENTEQPAVVESVAEAQAETPDVQQPQAEADTTIPSTVDETIENQVEDPQASAETIEQTEPIEEPFVPQQIPQYQPVDLGQYATEDGTLDVNAANQGFNQAVQQGVQIATSQIRLEMQEQREWDKAISAYPELKGDASLRGMVQQLRAGSVIENNGANYLSPKQAMDKIAKLRGSAIQQGVKQAQTHSRVQESAVLETSDTSAAPGTNRRTQLKDTLANARNPKEREAARKELMRSLSSNLLDQTLNR